MGWRDIRDLHNTDPDFGTGWLILGIFAVLLIGLLAFVVWASGSWVLGFAITGVAAVGLLLTST